MDEFHRNLTELRRAFHRDPELGFQEKSTKAKVARVLRDLGPEVHEGRGVIGVLRAGGGNLAIGLRARLPEGRQAVERFMRRIVDGVAAARGVTARMSFNAEFIETVNTLAPTRAVVRAAAAAGLKAIGDGPRMSFSEDFAHFCAAVPGCFFLLGNGETGAHGQPLHTADYDFNDALLPVGAALWARLVGDRLPTNPGKS